MASSGEWWDSFNNWGGSCPSPIWVDLYVLFLMRNPRLVVRLSGVVLPAWNHFNSAKLQSNSNCFKFNSLVFDQLRSSKMKRIGLVAFPVDPEPRNPMTLLVLKLISQALLDYFHL